MRGTRLVGPEAGLLLLLLVLLLLVLLLEGRLEYTYQIGLGGLFRVPGMVLSVAAVFGVGCCLPANLLL